VKPMAKEKAEYTNIIQLLKRLTRCESCRYVFQKKDRCFEKRDSEHPKNPDSYLRHCPKCSALVMFHAIAVPKPEEEKTK